MFWRAESASHPLPLPEGVPQVHAGLHVFELNFVYSGANHSLLGNPVRAEHAFPADPGYLDATSSVAASFNRLLLSLAALAKLGGRLRLPGALRRRPPSAAAALRAAGPRFARLG